MDLKEFEELVKKIDRKKYHVNRSIAFKEDGKAYIDSWNIYRKDMSNEEYYSPENLAILSSNYGNTLEDIKKFIEEGNKDGKNK